MNPSVTFDTLSYRSSSSHDHHATAADMPPPNPADNRNVVGHHPWLSAEKAKLLQTSLRAPFTGNHLETGVLGGINELRRRYVLALNELTADMTACFGKPAGRASSNAATTAYGDNFPLLRSMNPVFPRAEPLPRTLEAYHHPAEVFTNADLLFSNFQEHKQVDVADGRKILRTVTQSPTCTALPRCYYDYKKAYAAAALTTGDCGSDPLQVLTRTDARDSSEIYEGMSAACTSSVYQPPVPLEDLRHAAQREKQLLEHLSEVGAVHHQQARLSLPAAVNLFARRFSHLGQIPYDHRPVGDGSTAASPHGGRNCIAGMTRAAAFDHTSHDFGYVSDPSSDTRRDWCKLEQHSLSTSEAMIDHYQRVLHKTSMIHQEEEETCQRALFPHASMDGPIASGVDRGSSVDRQPFDSAQRLGSGGSTQRRKRSSHAGYLDSIDEVGATNSTTAPQVSDGSQGMDCPPSKRRRRVSPNGRRPIPPDCGDNFVDLTTHDDDPCRQTIRYFNNGVEVDEEGTPI